MGKLPGEKEGAGRALDSRPLHLFWVVGCSSSMAVDGRIGDLNTALREVTRQLRDAAVENPHAEVLVHVLTFSDGARWSNYQPVPLNKFRWEDLSAGGARDMGQALLMLAERLKFPTMPQRGLPPVLILVADGPSTDDFEKGLQALMAQPWGRKAVRLSVAVGKEADLGALQRFSGRPGFSPLPADNPEPLIRQIKFASIATTKIHFPPKPRTAAPLLPENTPREMLSDILLREPLLYLEPQRCEALLRDLCAAYGREVNLLVSALKQGVTERLVEARAAATPYEVVSARLTAHLVDNLYLNEAGARWAVDSWALALGLRLPSNEGPAERGHEVSGVIDGPTLSTEKVANRRAHRREIVLKVKRHITSKPPEPFWYKEKAEQLQRYIVGPHRKPLLLTGYDNFGDSYLAEWAIGKSAHILAEQTASSEDTVVARISANLVGKDSKGLWMTITDWAFKVAKNRSYERLKGKFKAEFELTGTYQYFSVRELTATEKDGGHVAKLQLGSSPFIKGDVEGKRKEVEVKKTFVPLDHQAHSQRLLQALAWGLPSEPTSVVMRFLNRLRKESLPYRILLLIDRIDDWSQLQALDSILDIGGALRVIVIVDKVHFDRWRADGNNDALLNRFQVVKCQPLLDEDLAWRFCQYFFETDGVDLNEPLLKDFIAALDYYCHGSPGRFVKGLRELWDHHMRTDAGGRTMLVLSRDAEFMSWYRAWARTGRLLAKYWKSICGEQAPIHQPDSPILGEHQIRMRLFLHTVVRQTLEKGSYGLAERDLLDICQETKATYCLSIPEETLHGLCHRLATYLRRANLLK